VCWPAQASAIRTAKAEHNAMFEISCMLAFRQVLCSFSASGHHYQGYPPHSSCLLAVVIDTDVTCLGALTYLPQGFDVCCAVLQASQNKSQPAQLPA
jgi:hypothetical protein